MYVCFAVTCHLHFWQNDRGLLHATVVTRGWKRYRYKSEHRKLTLEKKILLPLQRGFEPATFRSWVWRSNHWAIPAPISSYFFNLKSHWPIRVTSGQHYTKGRCTSHKHCTGTCYVHFLYIWLRAKRCANGDYLLSIKSVSNTLSCCCSVCAFIIGRYYSGNNELQIWSSWRKNKTNWKWKAPQNLTPENGHAHGECFQCFHSRTWRIKTLPQSPICTEEILLYTVHIKLIIAKFCFGS